MSSRPDRDSYGRGMSWSGIWPNVVVLCLALALIGCDEKGTEDFFQKALQHRANGEVAASIIELKNSLQVDPANAEARLLLGTIYLEVGDLAAAEKELGRARGLGMDGDRLIGPLVDLWLAQGEYPKILEELPSLHPPSEPPDAQLLLAEAKANQGLGRLAEAHSDYLAALDLEPDNLQAHYGVAWTARRLGDLDSARSTIAEALRLQPNNPDFIALKADLDIATGNRQEAEAGYRSLLKIQPENLEARVSLAGVLLARREYHEAVENLDTVLAVVPTHGNANYLRAAIAVEEEDYETAKRHSERVILTNPDHVPSLLIAASSNYALGLLEQADRYAARVLDLAPHHEFAATLRAAIRARQDEASSQRAATLIDDFAHPRDVASYLDPKTEQNFLRRIGIDCLSQAREGNPATKESGGPNDVLAEIRAAIDSGDLERALARIQEIENGPATGRDLKREIAKLYLDLKAFGSLHNTIDDLLSGGAADTEALCLAGPAYLAVAEPDKARLASRSLTESMSDSAAAYLMLAKAYRDSGEEDRYAEALAKAASIDPDYSPSIVEEVRRALALGDAAHASELLTRLGRDPDYRATSLDFQGGLNLLADRFAAAAEIYREAFEANPSTARALKWAYALQKADAPEESRKVLVTWLQDDADDDEALLALANKDLLAERYLEAAEGYSSVLQMKPDNIQALNNLAWTSLQLQQPEIAVQHAEKALQLAPDDPRVLDTLGYALVRQGDSSRAETVLRRADALAPENPQIRIHLAEALIAQRDDDEAKRLLQAVLSQAAGSGEREQAAELLKRLAP